MCVMINRLGGDVFGLLGIFDDEDRRGRMWPKKSCMAATLKKNSRF
jgi:hypothetical protein